MFGSVRIKTIFIHFYIYELALENGSILICHMLILAKVKIYIFEHFSDVLFEILKILLCTLNIKDRGINVFTRDYGHCITLPYLNSKGKIIGETKKPIRIMVKS